MLLSARLSRTMKTGSPIPLDSIALNRASGLAMVLNTPKGS